MTDADTVRKYLSPLAKDAHEALNRLDSNSESAGNKRAAGRWWTTFNAALSGYAAGGHVFSVDSCACDAATKVHGLTPDNYKGQR